MVLIAPYSGAPGPLASISININSATEASTILVSNLLGNALPTTMLPTIPTIASSLPPPDHLSTILMTTIPDPITILSTVAIVTASDMVPFVPCQPLAVTLGATLGPWAFPICVTGQTLAGILAFQSARALADTDTIQTLLDDLGDETRDKFQDFRRLGTTSNNDDNDNNNEGTVFLALVGLRLAPFFPFSVGNYLLGGATGVSLRSFVLATVIGCVFSNFVSVSVGMGGGELLKSLQ